MAGVGLRSETEFEQDVDRAKRNLDTDIHAMQVDAGADRRAKDKPVETTPQVMKKTKTKGEEAACAAAASSDPQNIPINTPNANPRPRRERSAERAGRTAPVSASVAAEATEAARSAAPSEGWYTKQQKQLASQGQTVVTMDMLRTEMSASSARQSKRDRKQLDKTIQQTIENTERIRALTKQAVYLLTEKRHTEDEPSAKQYDMGIPKSATQEDKTAFVTYILQEIGLTRASVQKVDVMETATGQDIWRMYFKDQRTR